MNSEVLKRFASARVVVLGDVMLDRFLYGDVARISPEAPVPVLSAVRQKDMPGGAANVARNVAALSAHVTLIGTVADDVAAASLRGALHKTPLIDVRLCIDTQKPTTVKCRCVSERQQLLRIDYESSSPISSALRRDVEEQYVSVLGSTDVVIISDYGKGLLSDQLLRFVIERAREQRRVVIVDPKGRDFSCYSGATIVKPNRQELRIATGLDCGSDSEVESAARRLLLGGSFDTVVVTRGAQGMSVVEREGDAQHLPGCPREVFDVSGAGDTAVAMLAVALASGASRAEAAELANVAAGLAVSKSGTAVVTIADIDAAIGQLRIPIPSARDKVVNLAELMARVESWRRQGLRIALTNGCFDLLHPGHISLLDQARRTADRLIVAMNSDSSVRELKGAGRPIQSEVARATLLASLQVVDAVLIFSESTPRALIHAVQPDVLVKGADYQDKEIVGSHSVLARGGRVVLAELEAGYSSTATLRSISSTIEPSVR